MITVGNNPEGDKTYNKFLSKFEEGQRGKLLAIKKGAKEAIILAMNNSVKGDVVWGRFYLVVETNWNEYPRVNSQVTEIPNTKDWKIV